MLPGLSIHLLPCSSVGHHLDFLWGNRASHGCGLVWQNGPQQHQTLVAWWELLTPLLGHTSPILSVCCQAYLEGGFGYHL